MMRTHNSYNAMKQPWQEPLIEQRVTYTVELEGRFYLVENVPARVNPETGEQYFSPQTVERLREMILGGRSPKRFVETPVYEYAD